MNVDGLSVDELYKKAKGYALRLFKFRPRSEAEFRAKLQERDYPAGFVNRLVDEFKEYGDIDDAAFARLWMQSRLKKYGFARVARELAVKGIEKEIVSRLGNELCVEIDERAVVQLIADRRLKLYRDLDQVKQRKRLMDYLLRRGFSPVVVNGVLKRLLIH